jgi:fatty acid desaturase
MTIENKNDDYERQSRRGNQQMTTNRTNRRTIANRLIKTLGAFTIFASIWVVLYHIASVIDPLGLISSLAAIAFLSAAVALLANLVVASSLLRI